MFNSITDVPGIRVGHYTDLEAATGCTVVLCEEGAVAGVDVRGSAPGTRETDLLRPMNLVEKAHAVLLSGGSAFGLDAAGGVMRYLEERGIGYQTMVAKVPIVPAAILFDLGLGSAKVRPDAEAGYRACLAATSGEVAEGSVGAGTGAVVGRLLGLELAMKGGLGTASQRIGEEIVVGAIVAVNAMGDVLDPETGKIIAGVRRPDGSGFLDTLQALQKGLGRREGFPTSTTIGVVATNAILSKEQINKVAQMAQDGLAISIRPVHTMADGDTLFALATGKGPPGDVSLIGTVAAQVVARAVARATRMAAGLHRVPGVRDLGWSQ